MEPSLTPFTAASRGVALWLAATVALVSALTAAGVMKPAFPNEAGMVAIACLLGAFLAAIGVWKAEPPKAAIAWLVVNVAVAAVALAIPVPLGLAR
ncbi:MAG: hypothetical protein V4510_04930 [bacterium]